MQTIELMVPQAFLVISRAFLLLLALHEVMELSFWAVVVVVNSLVFELLGSPFRNDQLVHKYNN